MQKITNQNLFSASKFIQRYARPLDIALYKYYFDEGLYQEVLDELAKFQNEDKGFGHGLEPDFLMPESSNMATTYAFQYLMLLQDKDRKLKVNELPEILNKSLTYLSESYDKKRKIWIAVSEKVNDSPHAIWWQFDRKKVYDIYNWGNPTVEIIGYLMKYENTFDKAELDSLYNQAIDRLIHNENIEAHELQCYMRMLELNKITDSTIVNKYLAHVEKTVEHDKTKWDSYVIRPSAYFQNKSSIAYEYLKDSLLSEVDYLLEQQESNGGWMPSWSWPNNNETWEKIKYHIAGMVSVRNLIFANKLLLHPLGPDSSIVLL